MVFVKYLRSEHQALICILINVLSFLLRNEWKYNYIFSTLKSILIWYFPLFPQCNWLIWYFPLFPQCNWLIWYFPLFPQCNWLSYLCLGYCFLNFKQLHALREKCPYSVRMRKIRTRKTPNMDTFHAVMVLHKNKYCKQMQTNLQKALLLVFQLLVLTDQQKTYRTHLHTGNKYIILFAEKKSLVFEIFTFYQDSNIYCTVYSEGYSITNWEYYCIK